mmetsp:Transcript_59247/g.139698  ORF Transcript_59247/g.139698 Transcript_59247/m.139698 type:complete len:208 (-) Transcript_59247:218-841(-)
MLASSLRTRPRPAAFLATALYLSASATRSVARVTMGRNSRPSGSRVLPAKNCVTESSPPLRIFSPSSTLMSRTALTSRGLAAGTAASAARFIAVTSSSSLPPWPVARSSLATSRRCPGSSILTSGLPRKPSGRPSSATAAWAPRSSAARMPAFASASVRFSAAAGRSSRAGIQAMAWRRCMAGSRSTGASSHPRPGAHAVACCRPRF